MDSDSFRFAMNVDDNIQFNVLARLPPNSIFKFKCLSRGINLLTERPEFKYEHSHGFQPIVNNPFTGFFFRKGYDYEKQGGDVQPFLSTCPDAGTLPDPCLNFLKDKKHGSCPVKVIDSCGGLLLCRTNSNGRIMTYCVCNPITKETVVLPPLPNPRPSERQNPGHYRLFVNQSTYSSSREGSGLFLQYKVIGICHCAKYDHVIQAYKSWAALNDSWSEMFIFSSGTGKWDEFGHKLPPLAHVNGIWSNVAVKEYMFWDCLDNHILVCNFKNSSAPRIDMIKAPKSPLGRCLWDHNGKLFCYCHVYEYGDSPVWSLYLADNDEFEWKNEDSEQFRTLTEDVSIGCKDTFRCRIIAPKVAPQVHFKSLAYNHNMKKMYLWISNSLYSYDFTDSYFELIVSVPGPKDSQARTCALPYIHSLMPLQKWR